MNFHVLTLFPEMIEQGLHTSILGKAMEKGGRKGLLDRRRWDIMGRREADRLRVPEWNRLAKIRRSLWSCSTGLNPSEPRS